MNAATAGRLVIAPAPLHQAAFAIHVPGPYPARESVVRAVLVAPFWRRIEMSVDAETACPLYRRTRGVAIDSPVATLPSTEGENRCVGWVHPNLQQHQKGEGR